MSRPNENRIRLNSTLDKVADRALKQLSEQLGLEVSKTLDRIILHYTKSKR